MSLRRGWLGHAQKIKRSESVFVPKLLQEYQMMPDGPGHGGVLPIRDPKLFGSLLHNPGQRSIVGMAYERAQVVDNVMVKPAHEPTDQRVFGCIIARCREDMKHPILKPTTVRGE